VSARIFLLLSLLALAIWPTVYLARHVRAAPPRRVAAFSALAYGWRRPYKAILSSVALVVILLAISWAALSDRPDSDFWDASFAAYASTAVMWLTFRTTHALKEARIQLWLTMRGEEIEREGHPFLYWLEVGFGTILATGLVASIGLSLAE
jgi:hypothetical protein